MTAFSIAALRLVRVGTRGRGPQLVLAKLPGALGDDALAGLEAREHRDALAVLVPDSHLPALKLLPRTQDVHERLALGFQHRLLGNHQRLDTLAGVEPYVGLLADPERSLAVGYLEHERGGARLPLDDSPEVDHPAGELVPRHRGSAEDCPHGGAQAAQVAFKDRHLHPYDV